VGKRINISKDDIEDLYLIQKLSSRQIAIKYNCSYVAILNWIRKFGFKDKIKTGHHLGVPNPKVSGELSPTKRPEVREKMSRNHADFLGIKNPNFGATWMQGENNPNWKGGITSFNEILRNSDQYNEWRLKVYAKDNYTCKICKKVGKNLHAHHIVYFSTLVHNFLLKHKDLSIDNDREILIELAYKDEDLWQINNGDTYCGECHLDLHPSMNYMISQ
jgi:hypothetical protein